MLCIKPVETNKQFCSVRFNPMLRSHCLQRLSDPEDSGSLSMKCLCEHSKGLLFTYILGIYVQNAQLLNFRCKSIQVKL